MEPGVQRFVDIVWMENSVTMSTGLVPMDVRLAITIPAVKEVAWRESKHRQNLLSLFTSPYSSIKNCTFIPTLPEMLSTRYIAINLAMTKCLVSYYDKMSCEQDFGVYTVIICSVDKGIFFFYFVDSFSMSSIVIRKKLFAKLQ